MRKVEEETKTVMGLRKTCLTIKYDFGQRCVVNLVIGIIILLPAQIRSQLMVRVLVRRTGFLIGF